MVRNRIELGQSRGGGGLPLISDRKREFPHGKQYYHFLDLIRNLEGNVSQGACIKMYHF